MYQKTIKTGEGLVKISTRFVGPDERIVVTLSGKTGTYIVDSSAILEEHEAIALLDAIKEALESRRQNLPGAE